jgi:N-acetylglucosamine-6-phosphate deacetylase
MIAITAAALFTPLERMDRPLLLVQDGVIVEVTCRAARELPGNCRIVDFPDATLAPGFIDLHIHGGAGRDVMETSPDALPAVGGLLAQHGVTGYFPTTITAPVDKTLAALECLAAQIEAAPDGIRARPLGIHLEGPFLSHARRGVHPKENLLPPTVPAFDRFWQAARGHISMMTIAPEVAGATEVIAEATRRGVCVSLGHSDAYLKEARAGVQAGARHATHTFNAMRPMDHRKPGILDLVLTEDSVSADIIADGIHVDPIVVKLFMRLKGPDRAVLITDALAATGMPEGHYRLGALEFDVKDGRCTSNGTLAGSILTMDRAVRNVMQFAELNLGEALRAASYNPAATVGIAGKRGVLAAGAAADFVVLNPQNEAIKTIVHGAGL